MFERLRIYVDAGARIYGNVVAAPSKDRLGDADDPSGMSMVQN